MDEIISLFRAKLMQQKIAVDILIDEPIHFQARTGEIRQVLINLISNAIDAMKKGGRLTLRAEFIEVDGENRVALRVEDTGHGIPDELLDRLFQPFVSTKGTLGTGLGLWVSQNIVERHHGHIEIDSRPGKTALSVILPVEYRGSSTGRRQESSEAVEINPVSK